MPTFLHDIHCHFIQQLIQKLFGAINYKAVHVADSTTATIDADVDIPDLTLMQLIVQYHNGSRLWCTCGWKPDELAAKFSGIGAFPGQEASSPEGMMDEKDIIRKMKELGLKVLE